MICWGVPRTLPSGPELSKTRFTILPSERWRFDLLRERDFDDLITLSVSGSSLVWTALRAASAAKDAIPFNPALHLTARGARQSVSAVSG